LIRWRAKCLSLMAHR